MCLTMLLVDSLRLHLKNKLYKTEPHHRPQLSLVFNGISKYTVGGQVRLWAVSFQLCEQLLITADWLIWVYWCRRKYAAGYEWVYHRRQSHAVVQNMKLHNCNFAKMYFQNCVQKTMRSRMYDWERNLEIFLQLSNSNAMNCLLFHLFRIPSNLSMSLLDGFQYTCFYYVPQGHSDPFRKPPKITVISGILCVKGPSSFLGWYRVRVEMVEMVLVVMSPYRRKSLTEKLLSWHARSAIDMERLCYN